MSRDIDPENMTQDDVEYVRQRPTLRREFMLQGYGDPLAEDYAGLVESDGDEDEEENEDPEGSEENGDEDEPYSEWDYADLKAEVARRELETDDQKKETLVAALEEDDEDNEE